MSISTHCPTVSSTHPPLLGGIQIPELDVSVPRSDEVAVILRERHGNNSAGHFI